jgi:hypothetical protein
MQKCRAKAVYGMPRINFFFWYGTNVGMVKEKKRKKKKGGGNCVGEEVPYVGGVMCNWCLWWVKCGLD